MRLRVFHIVTSLGRGGRERQLAIIAKNSNKAKNIIIYFNDRVDSYITEYSLEKQAHHVRKAGFLSRLLETRRIIAESKPDLIISWGTYESIIAIILCSRLQIPHINMSIRHGIRKLRFAHLLRTMILHLSTHIVANSFSGLKANNLKNGIVLYNGIEKIPVMANLIPKETLKRDRLNINPELPVIVTVANLVPYKDYTTTLDVLSRLKKEKVGFYFVIIGEGPNRNNIERIIEKTGLTDSVLMTGRIENVDYYLEAADIMVHSSVGEGCSNAILEGMKHGLPIIATNTGGTPEIVTKGNGFLFELGDSSALYKQLLMLIEDSTMRVNMGIASHRIVADRFSLERMILDYERIVEAIVAKDRSSITDLTHINEVRSRSGLKNS